MVRIFLNAVAALLLPLILIASPARAADGFEARRVAGSVVYVAIADDQRQTGSGSGFIVAPGIVVTNYHVASAGTRLFIVPNGDTGQNKVQAEVILKSPAHDLAILRVPGLKGRSLPIALGEPAQGVPIWAFGFPGLADQVSLEQTFSASLYLGNVSRVLSGVTGTGGQTPSRLVQHSALIAPGNSGGPLFDQCHRVVGINTFMVNDKASTFLYAVSATELVPLLRQAAVAANLSSSACGASPAVNAAPRSTPAPRADEPAADDSVAPTAPASAPSDEEAINTRQDEMARARASADRARERAVAARAARDRATAANNRAEAAKQDAIAEQAQKAADDLDAYSNALSKQLDDARDPLERLLPIGFAIALLILLALVVWLTRRRYTAVKAARDRGASALRAAEAEEVGRKGRDVTLRSPSGTIKLAGEDLESGITVGRSSERADVTIPKEAVSREHARFTRQAGRLYVYDLESANGTFVNGRRINPRQEVEVRSGDRVGFGPDLEFTLKFN